jgi:tRNA (guanine26-N2/guanine27-N2)-dimethyltransferase
MWLAPIHDTTFVDRVLKSIEGQEKEYGTWTRIHGMLTLAANVSRDESRLRGEITQTD